MTKHLLSGAVALALLVAATPADAQWKFGGALGAEHESSWDEFLVLTFEGRRPVSNGAMELAPRFSWFLREGVTRFQVDVNVIKPLVLANPGKFTPYVGLGGALESFSCDGCDGETAVGLNYVVGATMASTSTLQWYGQFQYSVLHDVPNTAVISAGALFRPGGARAR